MKKQIGMAVMALMFAMAQGCSKGTAASVEETEFVAEIRETEGEKQEEMESGTSEESPYSELEKLTGPEITETEVESKEQTESKKNNSLEPVVAGSMEDTETSTKEDSEKKIPRVSAEVPERASGTSATEALRESPAFLFSLSGAFPNRTGDGAGFYESTGNPARIGAACRDFTGLRTGNRSPAGDGAENSV